MFLYIHRVGKGFFQLEVSNNIQQSNISKIGYYQNPKIPVFHFQNINVNDQYTKNVNTPEMPFRLYVSNPSIHNNFTPFQLLNFYNSQEQIIRMMHKNPKVLKILEDNGIKPQISTKNIKNITQSHLMTTTAYALKIANQLDLSPNDKKILEKACAFHDFGKTLIPKEIIEKPGALSDEEREIVDLHSELGYELLSTTGMDKRVLDLIKNHHMPHDNESDILVQILSVADIYSALRENRSYKSSMSEKDALKILDQKALNGEVSTEVVNALKDSLKSAYVA